MEYLKEFRTTNREKGVFQNKTFLFFGKVLYFTATYFKHRCVCLCMYCIVCIIILNVKREVTPMSMNLTTLFQDHRNVYLYK